MILNNNNLKYHPYLQIESIVVFDGIATVDDLFINTSKMNLIYSLLLHIIFKL